jgi:hypothetical protein
MSTSRPRPSQDYRHIIVAIHGDWGSGKSWLADTAPGPRLIIDAEGGTLDTPSKKVVWDPHKPIPKCGKNDSVVVSVREWGTIDLVRQVLTSGEHPFNSVVVDSLTEIQKRLKDRLSQGPEAVFDQQSWGKLLNHMELWIRELRDLTWWDSVKPINVVIVTGTDDEIVPYRPMFQGGLRKSYPGFFDIVGYLTVADDADKNAEWHMQIRPNQIAKAKCRLHAVSVAFPQGSIPAPTIGKILAIVNPKED